MNTKQIRTAYYLNILIFILTVFSIIWIETGFTIQGTQEALTDSGLRILKFYTIDSNLFAAAASLIMALTQRKILKGEKKTVPNCCYILALSASVTVLLTFMVTLFFLVPTMPDWRFLYSNSSFFFHLVIPLLSVFTFVVLEKTDSIRFKDTFYGVLFTIFYAVYYVGNVMTHLVNGEIQPEYDWYGFFFLGKKSIVYVLLIILVIVHVFTVILWRLNKPKQLHS